MPRVSSTACASTFTPAPRATSRPARLDGCANTGRPFSRATAVAAAAMSAGMASTRPRVTHAPVKSFDRVGAALELSPD